MADGIPGWLERRLLAIPSVVDVLKIARTPEPDVGERIRAVKQDVNNELSQVVACARSGDEVRLALVLGEIDATIAALSALTDELS